MVPQDDPFTRRTFLRRAGGTTVALFGGSLWPAVADAKKKPKRHRPKLKRKPSHPVDHLVISCQENRSFDHYFGYALQVQALGYGPPSGYSQPDAGAYVHCRGIEVP